MEVCLTTSDGVQHLRLYGFLKKSEISIKSETVIDDDFQFGMIVVECDSDGLASLKLREDLFDSISVMESDDMRWGLYKTLKNENVMHQLEEFAFSFDFDNPVKSIDNMLERANETSITLFKKSQSFVDDYVDTDQLSFDEKMKDLEFMIGYFEDLERYEDCGILLNIQNKVKKEHLKNYLSDD